MNVGEAVDTELNLKANEKLPLISWPWQTVPKKLVTFCPEEPWAGHFSGSLYELILMIELFDRADPKTETQANENKKKIYAGTASAFLVSTGMHSAVELVYVVKNYLGVTINKSDILSESVCKDASKYIAGIISGISNKKK